MGFAGLSGLVTDISNIEIPGVIENNIKQGNRISRQHNNVANTGQALYTGSGFKITIAGWIFIVIAFAIIVWFIIASVKASSTPTYVSQPKAITQTGLAIPAQRPITTPPSSANTKTNKPYKQSSTLSKEIDAGKLEVERLKTQVTNNDKMIVKYNEQMEYYEDNEMTDEFNQLVPEYNRLIEKRRRLVNKINKMVFEVNEKVFRYNSGER